MGLMDRPHLYGHKRDPIPYPGGLSIFLTLWIVALAFVPASPQIHGVLLASTLIVLTSFWDDRKGLSPFLRLGVQFLAGLLLVFSGIGVLSISNPFGAAIVLDSWQIPFQFLGQDFTLMVFADLLTVIWVMVMVNAFNWIDGISGMSTSVSSVAALALLLLSTRPDFHFVDQTLAIYLSAIILGASLAAFFFDFPPARYLIGDTGSMLLGFLIAVTAIVSGGKIATTLLVLGFPILDFAWVIGRRIYQGKSPFKGDLWHFHHRFLKAGLSERFVVLFYALTAALFGLSAQLLQTEGKFFAFMGVFSLMFALGLALFKRH